MAMAQRSPVDRSSPPAFPGSGPAHPLHSQILVELICRKLRIRPVPPSSLSAPPTNETAPVEQPPTDNMAGELASVAKLGLKNLREILSAPSDYDDGPLLRAKNAAAQTALNAQLRADENRLQQRPDDKLAKLLEIIAEEEKRIAELRR